MVRVPKGVVEVVVVEEIVMVMVMVVMMEVVVMVMVEEVMLMVEDLTLSVAVWLLGRGRGLFVVVVDASVVAPHAVGAASVAAFVVAACSLGLASREQ